jgi:hypothetical protein
LPTSVKRTVDSSKAANGEEHITNEDREQ